MKKSFQKTLIAASVGAVLAVASIGAQAAGGNLLFPYVTTKAGAYTFVSVINDGNLTSSTAVASGDYHFVYMTKPIGSANSVGCNHIDAFGKTTANDLMQFEVSNKINMQTTFGDTTSTPVTLASSNVEGFLVIQSEAAAGGNSSNYRGEATVLDSSTGLYYTYSGIPSASNAGLGADYSAIPDAVGAKTASFYPASAVKTLLYITPVGIASTAAAGSTGMTPVNGGGIKLVLNNASGGAFDNNERPYSGTQTQALTCFGFVAPTDLLQPTTAANLANGGFFKTSATDPTVTTAVTTLPFLQHKIQTSTALGSVFTTISRDLP